MVPHANKNTLSGMVKFTSLATGQYVWYSVKIAVARAPPEDTINVKCTIRDRVLISIPVVSVNTSFFFTISLDNLQICGQIGASVDFSVAIEGNGLHGSPVSNFFE